MRTFTVSEWNVLPHGNGEGEIPEDMAERLCATARGSAFPHALSHERKGLRANQVVGIIVVDGCAVEILPKIDMPDVTDAAEARGRIRKRLVHMLAVALDIQISAGAGADMGWQRKDLLEILIDLFARKLADAVRQGMPRRYVEREASLATIRGRLDVVRQFTAHAVTPHRLACRFDSLSPDIALNQVMKAAVSRLKGFARTEGNRRLLAELAFTYGEVAEVAPSALQWDDIVLDRTNARWRELLDLARLLLGDRFQTTSAGDACGFALLFEMNSLFEGYVGRLLKRAAIGSDLKVHLQGGRRFCLFHEESAQSSFQTKPDILINRNGAAVHIIDTKWKRVAARIDDRKQGVSQADVYQMMAYGRVYGCPRLTLLYPHHGDLPDPPGLMTRHLIAGSDDRLDIATVDVTMDRKLLSADLRALLAA